MVLKTGARKCLGLILLLFCFTWSFTQDAQSLSKKESKLVMEWFSEEWSGEKLVLPEQHRELSGLLMEDDQVHIIRQQDRVLGYLISTRALGRYDYFDYLIAFKPDFSVLGLSIMIYRSTHGAAICQKKWLSQFDAYAGEELSYGKDIDALAGATLSATSLVKDVQRCYQIMITLKKAGLIP